MIFWRDIQLQFFELINYRKKVQVQVRVVCLHDLTCYVLVDFNNALRT